MQITHTCSQNILTPLAPDLSLTFSLTHLFLTLSSGDGVLSPPPREPQDSQDDHMLLYLGRKRSTKGPFHTFILSPNCLGPGCQGWRSHHLPRLLSAILSYSSPSHPAASACLMLASPLLSSLPRPSLSSPPSPYLIVCPFK